MIFSLDTPKNVSVTNVFKAVTCDMRDSWHAMCFGLFTVTSTHSIRKKLRKRNSKTTWYRRFNCSMIKAPKTKKLSKWVKTVWRKIKEKVPKRRYSMIRYLKITLLLLLLENLSHQVWRYLHTDDIFVVSCRWWMKHTIKLASANWQKIWSYSRSSFIRSI